MLRELHNLVLQLLHTLISHIEQLLQFLQHVRLALLRLSQRARLRGHLVAVVGVLGGTEGQRLDAVEARAQLENELVLEGRSHEGDATGQALLSEPVGHSYAAQIEEIDKVRVESVVIVERDRMRVDLRHLIDSAGCR